MQCLKCRWQVTLHPFRGLILRHEFVTFLLLADELLEPGWRLVLRLG
jgi:hypothetical protein